MMKKRNVPVNLVPEGVARSLALFSTLLLAPAAAHAQYVGKVGQGAGSKKPVLRATAVYEYTGDMHAPSSSRLVPVVIWDGDRYEPGGLYLARPEPLAVAPGTQYVLEQSGVPAGLFNLASAAQLNTASGSLAGDPLAGSWIGLGRFAPLPTVPPPARLAASKKLPVLSGGSGEGRAAANTDGSSGPVLHRKTGTDPGSSAPSTAPAPAGGGDEPTLHRRDGDTSSSSSSDSSSGSSSGSSSDSADGPTLHRRDAEGSTGGATEDPDRPTLHRADTGNNSGTSSGASSGTSSGASPDPDRPTLHRGSASADASPEDPDRPTLHRHADGSLLSAAPDPDRPHLRYGQAPDAGTRVLPAELKDAPGAPGVKVGEVVAVSDTVSDEPHPFAYTWPSATAAPEAALAMHALALRALASAAHATFGPAAAANAKTDAALKQAADSAERSLTPSPASSAAAGKRRAPAPAKPVADPLADPDFRAFQLSYDGVVTYVYSAHTLGEGAARRYVTVIAQPDFYGKPHAVLTETTRGDMLEQTPALRLIDAVDANGDHRAELLFDEETIAESAAAGAPARRFVLYNVTAGQALLAYATVPGAQQ